MAISSVGTKLLAKDTGGKYTQLVKILTASALSEAPAEIDVTALDDIEEITIPGRAKAASLKCTYNYTAADFDLVKAKISTTDSKDYLLLYNDNSAEKFTARAWQGNDAADKDGQIKTNLQFYISAHEHVTDATELLVP